MPNNQKKPITKKIPKIAIKPKAASNKGETTFQTSKKPAKTTGIKSTPRESKQATLIALLLRSTGATIDEMIKATGWQKHSVRGVISGAIKKRLGLPVTSEQEERGRIYRITGRQV